MLTRLTIDIENNTDQKLTQHSGSLLHGALIEVLEPQYAEYLHNNSLKPFSQYLSYDKPNNCYHWHISTITDDAREHILNKLTTSLNGKLNIKHKNLALDIKQKILSNSVSYKELSELYYLKKEPQRKVRIQFVTPTTFKSNGDFVIFPQINSIYNSLLNKWNTYATEVSLKDENILEHLISHTHLIGYNLRSTKFEMEGIRINSFKGEICLLIKGPESLVRIANLLLAFGEYSGVGAKTALGMGGIKIA
jgi:CRISPR-associated endoribonuclease Cas6